MKENALHKNYKIVILLISIVLFTLGAYFHTVENYALYRLVRGSISLLFLVLLYYYHRNKINKPLSLFLFFYGASSIATIGYENDTLATISMVLNFLSYLVLIIALIPKVNFKKMKGLFLIGFIATAIINGYLIYRLIEMIRSMSLSSMHFVFIYISTIALLTLAFLTLLYNHTHSTKGTLTFSLFVFLIVFSEVFRAFGYYDLAFGNLDVYIARILLIVAMGTLIHYSMIGKKKEELLKLK